LGNKIDGATLVLVDIDDLVRSQQAIIYAHDVMAAETADRFIYDLGNGQWNIRRLRELLEKILPQSRAVEDFEVVLDLDPVRKSERILLTIANITERKQMERKIPIQAKDLADMNRREDEFLAMPSHELRSPLVPIINMMQLLCLQKN
jgi:two-component system CheB/CheR fusion protein